MQDSSEIVRLLTEIRDTQSEQVAEYKKVTQRSMELQERAVKRQEQMAKTYRIVLIVSALLITGIVFLIMYLVSYMNTRYR